MEDLIKQFKRLIVVNGAFALLAAIALMLMLTVFPVLTIRGLVLVLVAYLLVEGVIALYSGIKNKWKAYSLAGVLSVLLGVVLAFWPAPTVLALTWAFALWSLALGVSRLVNAFTADHEKRDRFWQGLNGVLSLLMGGLLLTLPITGVISFAVLLIVYFFVLGVALLLYGASLEALENVISENRRRQTLHQH